jgi:peptide/nickel transport system substrate-binding protein
VRRALALAIDGWHGAPRLARIANVHTVGGIVFPGSPLAATEEELQKIAGFSPYIEKSRGEAKRLLKDASAEGLSFELLNRNIDQPYKPAFPGWYRILRCNGSDYRIGYNMLSGIERGSHGGPGG